MSPTLTLYRPLYEDVDSPHALSRHGVSDLSFEAERAGGLNLFMEMRECLTFRLVVYMLGAHNTESIGEVFNHGIRSMSIMLKTREIYRIFSVLKDHEDPITLQAWFMGLNPLLNHKSPATLLHEDLNQNAEAVFQAAVYFTQNS